MESYARLFDDNVGRQRILTLIQSGKEAACQLISELLGSNIPDRRRSQLANIECRGPALNIPNHLQIVVLKSWRPHKNENPQKAETMLPLLLMITYALSGGLKHTG